MGLGSHKKCCEEGTSLSFGLLTVLAEAFRNGVPVDDLPNSLEVVGANVLVLKVVSVLPDINAQQWDQASGRLERILIGSCGDLQTLELLVVALVGSEKKSIKSMEYA